MTEFQKLTMQYKSEYHSFIRMKQRCSLTDDSETNKHYKRKNIRVCQRWLEYKTGFINFMNDMKGKPTPEHTIERIDNDGDYTPENCCWATRLEQTKNRTVGKMITFNGKTQNLINWSKELNLSYETLKYRINNGWSDEDALTIIAENRGSGKKRYKNENNA